MGVTAGARWHMSTHSDTSGCVEVAENLPGRVYMRDTKDRDGGTLAFAPARLALVRHRADRPTLSRTYSALVIRICP